MSQLRYEFVIFYIHHYYNHVISITINIVIINQYRFISIIIIITFLNTNKRKFRPVFKTKRSRNSFIIFNAL